MATQTPQRVEVAEAALAHMSKLDDGYRAAEEEFMEALRSAGDPRYYPLVAKSGIMLYRSRADQNRNFDLLINKAVQENQHKPNGWRVLLEKGNNFCSNKEGSYFVSQNLELLVNCDGKWLLKVETHKDAECHWDAECHLEVRQFSDEEIALLSEKIIAECNERVAKFLQK